MPRKNLMQLVRKAKNEAKRAQPLWWVRADAYPSARGGGWCLRVEAARADQSARRTEVWHGGMWLGCGYSESQVKRAKQEFERGWPRGVRVLKL